MILSDLSILSGSSGVAPRFFNLLGSLILNIKICSVTSYSSVRSFEKSA